MKFFSFLFFCLLLSLNQADALETGCWFSRDAQFQLPLALKNFRIENFLIFSNDPQRIAQHEKTLAQSVHFVETELGWKFPYTKIDGTGDLLEVYFVSAVPEFTGTVLPGPRIVLNETVLGLRDFSAIWMHYLAHASQVVFRDDLAFDASSNAREIDREPFVDFWFAEATAGWMEGQFGTISIATEKAQEARKNNPGLPLDASDPEASLGASAFLETVTRPYRDVMRQTWEQWSYAREERVLNILARVLELNHLPGLHSYLLGYFLRAQGTPDSNTTDVVIKPYSAFVAEEFSEDGSGGIQLTFSPSQTELYGASLIYYGKGEKEGIVALKETQKGPWSLTVPYTDMQHYKLVIVNSSDQPLKGSLVKRFDPTIPAAVDYFRATEDDEGGVQLEWKTSRENGVAFWNVYRTTNGTRERLNSLPIPASIDSSKGLHYLFVDYSNGTFYSLEAMTQEGFPCTIATTKTGRTAEQE